MKAYIRQRIAAGWTKKQIDDDSSAAEHSAPQVLARPAQARLRPARLAAAVRRRSSFGARRLGVGARGTGSRNRVTTRRQPPIRRRPAGARRSSPRAPSRQDALAIEELARLRCLRSSRSRSSPGSISVITPCVLPLVPGYLSAVSAVEVDRLGERGAGRRVVHREHPVHRRLHGRLRGARRRRGGGRQHGRQDDPDPDRRLRARRDRARVRRPAPVAGAARSRPGSLHARGAPARRLLLGGAFAVVAAPCIGTVLASILVLAGSSGGVARGVVLLLAYSLGLGAAFVLAGVAFAHAMRAFRWVRSHYQALRIASGVDADRPRAAALLQPRLVAPDRARPAVLEGRPRHVLSPALLSIRGTQWRGSCSSGSTSSSAGSSKGCFPTTSC